MTRKAYIFDIDGTLADLSHRLHFIQQDKPDWDAFFAAVEGDTVIEHIAGLARIIYGSKPEMVVLFVSGRSDQCRTGTLRWLDRHDLECDGLYMRKVGDHRPDNIIKKESLVRIRADGYEPVMAFDDRDQVVKMWRDSGVPCAQVAPGDF